MQLRGLMKRYAISDIHGCSQSFAALLHKIGLSKTDELYLLGDYIDRGPDSKGVFDTIMELQKNGYQVHCLRGNHEQLLLDARHDPRAYKTWYLHGGKETLASFGCDAPHEFPQRYLDFMDQLDYYFLLDQCILVHAGLNFTAPDPLADTHSMMWIRRWYDNIDRAWLGDRRIVHGHTPTARRQIELQLAAVKTLPVVVIDNGCVYNRVGTGQLCALDLDDWTLTFQPRID